jgi:hypothetical protein
MSDSPDAVKAARALQRVAGIPYEAARARLRSEAEQGATLDPERVDRALRSVIELLDYDLHKSLECDESTGEDTYCDEVAAFIEAYGEGG